MIELQAEVTGLNDVDEWEDEYEFLTDEFLDDAEEQLARTGARLVRDYASSHIRGGRGAYVRRIRAEGTGGRWAVTDQRSDYGPWLAGSSRRNRRSEFKGYPHWDEAREELNRDKVRIVAPQLRGYRARLRGGR